MLAALARQLQARLPEAVRHARQEWLTWDDIAVGSSIPASTLRRRYSRHAEAQKGAAIDT